MYATSKGKELVSKSGMQVGLIEDKDGAQKKRKKRILDEDTFVNTLDKIIERDFFPDLPKLKENLEYQDAVERNDVIKLRELRKNFLSKFANRREKAPDSPAGFETPLNPNSNPTPPRQALEPETIEENENNESDTQKNIKPDIEGLSLDRFLAKYNSEDNSSFDEIMVQAQERHQQKYPWLYLDEAEEVKKIEYHLTVPAIENQCNDKYKPSSIATWKYKNKNTVMNFPDGAPLTGNEIVENLKRQKVVHENTRFQTNPFNERLNSVVIAQAAIAQAKENSGKIGVDGKELSSDLINVNGYSIVSMTPSPAPSLMDTPLMTWGAVDSTPLRLDAEETPMRGITPGTPQFRIPEQPLREKLAHSLSDKLSKQTHDKKQKALKQVTSTFGLSPSFSSSPRTPIERLSSMSPAAQRFAASKLKIHSSSDKKLMESYSPSPLRISSPSLRKTPVLSNVRPREVDSGSSVHQSNKRKQASDFF